MVVYPVLSDVDRAMSMAALLLALPAVAAVAGLDRGRWRMRPCGVLARVAIAIRAVARGEALLASSVTRLLITEFASRAVPGGPPMRTDLRTEREREVLLLVTSGMSNDEIAARLVISPATAKTHISRILTKLGARDRAQLIVMAYESGLVQPGDR
jgi:DNA-binding NarL/FixJ family response regulator